MNEELITCTCCGFPKLRKDFYDGRIYTNATGKCKKCELEYQKQQRKNKGEPWLKWNREYVARWRKEHPERVRELNEKIKLDKLPRICPDCKTDICWVTKHRCKNCWLKHKDKKQKTKNERAKQYWMKKSALWTEEDKKKEADRKRDWYKRNKDRILKNQKEYRDGIKK